MAGGLWTVLMITYEDDYKHRYDNGVYPENIRVFTSEEEAKEYVCERIADEIEEHICAYDIKLTEDQKKYFTCHNKGNKECEYEKIKEEFRNDYQKIIELHEIFCHGEFVDFWIDWELEEHSLAKINSKLEKSERKQKIYKQIKKFFKDYTNDNSIDFHERGLEVLKKCYDIYNEKNIIV